MFSMPKPTFTVSTDSSKLDVEMIHQYLSKESYWAKGRTRETVETSIKNSLCFGIYTQEKQIGFTRVATDYAIFAWIMDVFILPEYRGLGASKQLMQAVISHEALANLRRWGLMTHDAHTLYQQVGFLPLTNQEYFMEYLPEKK